MDIKKISNLNNPTPAPTDRLGQTPGQGPSFADTLGRFEEISKGGSLNAAAANPKAFLPGSVDGVKFSNHAMERMLSRGIQFNKEDMGRLNEAVQKAAAKGAKDSLILMNESALIVSVKNKTVVTVMDKNALKENVFTNIDSTVVM